MTYHQDCTKSNMIGATCGLGAAYPSWALTPVFSGIRVTQSLVFCVM
jgi:hypothetical protein